MNPVEPAATREFDEVRAAVRTPRAAAAAGIIFSILFAVVLVLEHLALPATASDATTWMTSTSKRDATLFAINLLPVAAIAFLWLIGVMRDRLGDKEDRFFSTAFLGSGLLFVATLAISGATITALVAATHDHPSSTDLWQFGTDLNTAILNYFALRFAAVFTSALTTLAGRLGIIPRWITITGYATAATLLIGVGWVPWLALLFPTWILLLSLDILVATIKGERTHAPAPSQRGEPTPR